MEKLPLEQHFKENENLIHFASQKALQRFSAAGLGDRVEYEEIFCQLREVFLKTYSKFDPEKAKFSTYFVNSSTNYITNEIQRMYRQDANYVNATDFFANSDIDDESSLDNAFGGEEAYLEEQVALESEVSLMRSGLSPLAQLLFDYSVNPLDFIIQEFHAQRAQCAFATSIGLKTSHPTEIDLRFVANCLKKTASTPAAVRFINNAVDEVKTAVLRAVSD